MNRPQANGRGARGPIAAPPPAPPRRAEWSAPAIGRRFVGTRPPWPLLLGLLVGCHRDALPPFGVDAAATDLGPPRDLQSADTGAPDLARRGPTLDDLARLCTLVASCGAQQVPPQRLSASQCTVTLLEQYPADPVTARLVGCAGATTCAALFACYGNDLLLIQAVSREGRCQGSAIEHNGHRFDCARVGLACVPELFGRRVHCAPRACGPNFTAVCVGDLLQRCSDNVPVEVDCRRLGATCRAGDCVGLGAACNPPPIAESCDGPLATVCMNGHRATRDCAREALRTRCADGRCGYPLGRLECLIGNSMCMGPAAVLCAGDGGGEWRTIDCRSLGFQGCALDPIIGDAICR